LVFLGRSRSISSRQAKLSQEQSALMSNSLTASLGMEHGRAADRREESRLKQEQAKYANEESRLRIALLKKQLGE